MIRIAFIVALLIASTLSAPSNDKMTSIPVRISPTRAILLITIPASILAISVSSQMNENCTMFLYSQLMEPIIKIQSLSGSMEDQAALP